MSVVLAAARFTFQDANGCLFLALSAITTAVFALHFEGFLGALTAALTPRIALD